MRSAGINQTGRRGRGGCMGNGEERKKGMKEGRDKTECYNQGKETTLTIRDF